MSKTVEILIIGGGYAGVKAALDFNKTYRRNSNVRITLVDKNRFHTLMTELHEIAGNRVPQASVRITYERIFSGTRVNVVHDQIEQIDFADKMAIGRTGIYRYNYTLICAGGEPADFNIPGIKEHSLSLWSLDDALNIRNRLERNFRMASLEPNPNKRRKLLSVVVAGGGFTGVELVGELIEYLPTLCRKYGLSEHDFKLYIIEALGEILGMLPKNSQDKAVAYMEKKGVDIRTNALIVKAEEEAFHLRDGTVLEAGILVWTCGVKANSFLENLNLEEGKAGRREVDKYMRSPGHQNVYLAGDGIWFIEDGKPIPQIVEAAEQTAETAVRNIILSVDAEPEKVQTDHLKEYRGRYHGYMVSIGSRYAVSHTGGISLSGFPATAIKHLVNLYYQVGIVGINGIWSYLKHEILDIKNNRSLIGGFAAWKSPNYWLFPLRVYIGVMWLLQGIKKIGSGWLKPANDFVSVASSSDAGSAASAAETAGSAGAYGGADTLTAVSESITNGAWTSSAAVTTDAVAAATYAAEAASESAGGYSAALLSKPWFLYTWFAELTVNRIPFLFQSGIVIFEILIGLALIGGAFTWLAAAASFVFSIMLIVGAMTDASIFWYMVSALAMLGGAGRAFGLDYWIMPFIKRWWNGTALARKTHFYVGEPSLKKKK